jgi:hypothetical protein
MRRLIARRGVGGTGSDKEDEEGEGRGSTQRQSSRMRSGTPSSTPVVTPQPHSRSTLTDHHRRTVNFQTPATEPRASPPAPVLRISDPDRSFAFTPTKSLDWTVLRRSMELQEEDLSPSPRHTTAAAAKRPTQRPNPSRSAPSTNTGGASPAPSPSSSSSPSPQRTSRPLRETTRLDQSLDPPPPPPPDSFPLEVAWETSKIPGHNVGSNAAKVESYMSKLQRYLEASLFSLSPPPHLTAP